MPPEQRRDQRRTAFSAGKQVGARAGVEHQLGELAVVAIARLMQLRPPVVVAAVGVSAALEQQRHDRQIAGHPEQVVAIRPALNSEIGKPVEQLDEALAIVVLDRLIGEHERGRWFIAALHCLDVAAQLAPAREPVARGEVAPCVRGADSVHGGDSVGASLVVVEVGAKRLLERQALDVRLELRPALETQLARELELHLGQLDVLSLGTALAHALLGLLAQLLQAELKSHCWLPSVAPGARLVRLERKPGQTSSKTEGGLGPFRRTGCGPRRAPKSNRRSRERRRIAAMPIGVSGACRSAERRRDGAETSAMTSHLTQDRFAGTTAGLGSRPVHSERPPPSTRRRRCSRSAAPPWRR